MQTNKFQSFFFILFFFWKSVVGEGKAERSYSFRRPLEPDVSWIATLYVWLTPKKGVKKLSLKQKRSRDLQVMIDTFLLLISRSTIKKLFPIRLYVGFFLQRYRAENVWVRFCIIWALVIVTAVFWISFKR